MVIVDTSRIAGTVNQECLSLSAVACGFASRISSKQDVPGMQTLHMPLNNAQARVMHGPESMENGVDIARGDLVGRYVGLEGIFSGVSFAKWLNLCRCLSDQHQQRDPTTGALMSNDRAGGVHAPWDALAFHPETFILPYDNDVLKFIQKRREQVRLGSGGGSSSSGRGLWSSGAGTSSGGGSVVRITTLPSLPSLNMPAFNSSMNLSISSSLQGTQIVPSLELPGPPVSFVAPSALDAETLEAWVVKAKPTEKKKEGTGIFLSKDFESMLLKASASGLVRQAALCQRYISAPLLLRGYKFDVRLYVLMVGGSGSGSDVYPYVYLCREGMARFCSALYDGAFSATTTQQGRLLREVGFRDFAGHFTNASDEAIVAALSEDERAVPGVILVNEIGKSSSDLDVHETSTKHKNRGAMSGTPTHHSKSSTIDGLDALDSVDKKRRLSLVLQQLEHDRGAGFSADAFWERADRLVRTFALSVCPFISSSHAEVAADIVEAFPPDDGDVPSASSAPVYKNPFARKAPPKPKHKYSQPKVKYALTQSLSDPSSYIEDVSSAKISRAPAPELEANIPAFQLFSLDILVDEHMQLSLLDATGDVNLAVDEPIPLLDKSSRWLHEPSVGPEVRTEYCICSERAGPHRHSRSLVDSNVKTAVGKAALATVAEVFPYSGLSDPASAHLFQHVPLTDSDDDCDADFFQRVKRLERLYLSFGGYKYALLGKTLRTNLLPLVRAGKLELLDIDMVVRTYASERRTLYGNGSEEDVRDEGQRLADFVDIIVRIAGRIFPDEPTHAAVDGVLAILKM